jgi:hypothetical protein
VNSTSDDAIALDAAHAAKDVAILTALVLIQTSGDPACAIAMLDDIALIAEPLETLELDAPGIAQQAIRQATDIRDELRG